MINNMVIDLDSVSSNELEKYTKNDKKCAPDKQYRDGSCMPLEVLIDMANAYNNEFDDKIKLHNNMETLNPGKYKRYLVKSFGSRLNNICDSQRCWVKQKFVSRMRKELKNIAKKESFRPEGPEGQFTWLNTYNINDVMGQYEKKYSDFKFMGAVPIDFDELPHLGIADLDYNNMMDNGKTKLGFVFNLDEHYKKGSHWVGMYTNLSSGQIFFFDSYGIAPEKRIRKLMRRIGKFCDSKNIKVDSRYNKVRHQYKNSECGVYSINFILRLLKGESFEDITNNVTTDSEVNRCRDIYFNKSK